MHHALSGIFRKSTKDLTALGKEYPPRAEAYELLEDCGKGVSATVYKAYCKPMDEVVAVKKMNLESVHSNLDEIVHEAQLMRNYHHPNVLPLYTSFVHGSDLWMVMPFISGGSVLHIMKYAHPEGLEELVISTIMRDVLKALDYVHRQGGIHRDIKAGNILVNMDGTVKLADFGVATNMDRTGSWGHDKCTRMTFVGTPCWMAPEVMEQTAGYDNAADIWSFGIAMLEMAHGHAPFAKYPPMKVLLMTLQNPPPSLEDKGKKHFSKAMRDVVTRCLQKDPRSRPTAAHLLEHKFFKQARDEEYLAKHLMAGLPPLGERVQEIRQGKAATKGVDNERNFMRSQEEYKKGVSSWNFDVAALKAAAEMEQDDEPMLPTIKEDDGWDDDRVTGGLAQTQQQAGALAAAAAVAASGPAPVLAAAGAAAAAAAVVAVPSDSAAASVPTAALINSNSFTSSFSTAVEHSMVAAGGSSTGGAPPSEVTLGASGLSGVGNAAPSDRSLAAESWGQWTSATPTPQDGPSREPSTMGSVTAPGTVKQPARTKGRFSVYSESDPVPPMSPSSPPQPMQLSVAGESAAAGSSNGGAPPAPVPAQGTAGATPPAPSSKGTSGTTTPMLSPSASMANPHLTPAGAIHGEPGGGSGGVRRSDDGIKREASEGNTGLPPSGPSSTAAPSLGTTSMPVAGGVLPGATSVQPGDGGEAKKKGRFTVIENNPTVGVVGLERKTSHAALGDGQYYRSGGDYVPVAGGPALGTLKAEGSSTSLVSAAGPPLPKPPPAGSQHVLPVTSILPRLQELLDHSSQQHAALHRLLSAVQESDAGGKSALALLRPGRGLFDVSSGGAAGSGGGVASLGSGAEAGTTGNESVDELRHMVRSLQARLSGAETENARLRARNAQLEANFGVAAGGGGGSGGGATPGVRTRETSETGGPNAHSNGPVPSPRHAAQQQASPRPAWSPRASEDGIR